VNYIKRFFEKVSDDDEKDEFELSENDLIDDEDDIEEEPIPEKKQVQPRKVDFFGIKDGKNLANVSSKTPSSSTTQNNSKVPFSKRILGVQSVPMKKSATKTRDNNVEFSFSVRDKNQEQLDLKTRKKTEQWKKNASEKRGIRDLNLPKYKVPKYHSK